MKKLACVLTCALFAALSFSACGGSSDSEAPTGNAPSADLSRFAKADPCVVATVSKQARDAALDALSKAPKDADPKDKAALADQAAARVYADANLDSVKCDGDVKDAPLCTAASAGQVTTASWGDILCRAACWAAAGAGCGAISVACTGVTVITIGGTSIPCGAAIIAGCGAAGGGASVCSDLCSD